MAGVVSIDGKRCRENMAGVVSIDGRHCQKIWQEFLE